MYSMVEDKSIKKFSIGNEMVRVSVYREGHVIVYTSTKQFILSREIDSNKIV